jgi:hypothetical protein
MLRKDYVSYLKLREKIKQNYKWSNELFNAYLGTTLTYLKVIIGVVGICNLRRAYVGVHRLFRGYVAYLRPT